MASGRSCWRGTICLPIEQVWRLINSPTNPTTFGALFWTDCQVFARWDVPALETSIAISHLNACHQGSPLHGGEDLGEGGLPFRVAAILDELINHHTGTVQLATFNL